MAVGITERGDAGRNLVEWIAAAKQKKVEFTIAITKAPSILLANFDKLPKNIVIHATITGWGSGPVESYVLHRDVEIPAYQELVHRLGPQRVVLRIDPIIPTGPGIEVAQYVASQCKGRMRISILDLYPHVRERFAKEVPLLLEELEKIYGKFFHLPISHRRDVLHLFPNAEICGEPGFKTVGCISTRDYEAVGLPTPIKLVIGKQRPACNCLSHKTELLVRREPCGHKCLYCYWK